MYFDNFTSFMTMGGHGTFVWSAYAVASLVIIYNLVAPVLARKKLVTRLHRQEKLQAQQRVKRTTISSADFQTVEGAVVERRSV